MLFYYRRAHRFTGWAFHRVLSKKDKTPIFCFLKRVINRTINHWPISTPDLLKAGFEPHSLLLDPTCFSTHCLLVLKQVPPAPWLARSVCSSVVQVRSAQRCQNQMFQNTWVRKHSPGPRFLPWLSQGWVAGSGKLIHWCQEWFSQWQCVESSYASCCNIQ